MRQMLEAGVHFEHNTRRWNPRMDVYFGERNKIHILDLQQTMPLFNAALERLAMLPRWTSAVGPSGPHRENRRDRKGLWPVLC